MEACRFGRHQTRPETVSLVSIQETSALLRIIYVIIYVES